MELVKYVASDGDLCDTNCGEEYKMNGSRESNDDVLVNFQNEAPKENLDTPCMGRGETEESSEKGVPQLVEEAMNDTTFVKPARKKGS